MVLITEQKIKIGKYFLNFVTSKLRNAKVERTLFLIPGGLGKDKDHQIYFKLY